MHDKAWQAAFLGCHSGPQASRRDERAMAQRYAGEAPVQVERVARDPDPSSVKLGG